MEFLCDAVVCAMERWLLAKDCMPPEEFVKKIKTLIEKGSVAVCREMVQANHKFS